MIRGLSVCGSVNFLVAKMRLLVVGCWLLVLVIGSWCVVTEGGLSKCAGPRWPWCFIKPHTLLFPFLPHMDTPTTVLVCVQSPLFVLQSFANGQPFRLRVCLSLPQRLHQLQSVANTFASLKFIGTNKKPTHISILRCYTCTEFVWLCVQCVQCVCVPLDCIFSCPQQDLRSMAAASVFVCISIYLVYRDGFFTPVVVPVSLYHNYLVVLFLLSCLHLNTQFLAETLWEENQPVD